MADQFDALISGVPTDADSQKAIAAALRRQSILGQMYQTTGDRVIAPMGEGMTQQADTQAHQLGQERQAQAHLSQTLAMQQAQHDEEVRNHTMQNARSLENNKNNAAYRTQIADMQDQTRRDLAAQKAAEAAAKAAQGKPLPIGAGKEIEGMQDSLRGVDDALTQAQALHAQGQQIGGMGRNIKNFVASNTPFGTDSMNQDQNFWAQYGRAFTLPELKATIGVRHNEYMQNLFESYHLNPNMSNEQIINNLAQISKQGHDRITTRAADYASQGYDVGKYAEFPASASPGGAAPSAADAFRAKARSQAAAPPAPAATVPAMKPPTSALFPQSMGQPQPPPQPYVPGGNFGSMFAGLPGMNA